jgi:hypothetical protein
MEWDIGRVGEAKAWLKDALAVSKAAVGFFLWKWALGKTARDKYSYFKNFNK